MPVTDISNHSFFLHREQEVHALQVHLQISSIDYRLPQLISGKFDTKMNETSKLPKRQVASYGLIVQQT